jgi:hypothetical protein
MKRFAPAMDLFAPPLTLFAPWMDLFARTMTLLYPSPGQKGSSLTLADASLHLFDPVMALSNAPIPKNVKRRPLPPKGIRHQQFPVWHYKSEQTG